MGMLKEFREFAMKGNVVDLAVGVIIGAAFGAIVTSLVSDVIMPIIGAITGGLDFSNYFIPLSKSVTAGNLADAKKQGAVLAYGQFLTLTLNFFIPRFMPGSPLQALRDRGWRFYTFIGGGARFMFAWDADPARIDALVRDIRAVSAAQG